MTLIRTPAGHLLQWERGTYRYTLGYRFGHFKWFYVSRWSVAFRWFAAHFITWPMTEVEKRNRGLT